MGHTSELVYPRKMSTPLPNWSHLERFRCTHTTDGGTVSLTTTSPQARWIQLLKAKTEGTVISPEQKKPKKQMETATLSMARSGGNTQTLKMSLSIGRVMGRRILTGSPEVARYRLTPVCNSLRRGIGPVWAGSGRPLMTWTWRIPAR